jgi:dipeptidyl aminopeptidase/acylaminoacyl peptidase
MAGKPKSLEDQFATREAGGFVALVARLEEARGTRAPASLRPLVPFFLFLLALPAFAQAPYKQPPKEVVDLLDAPPPPQVVVSPRGDAVLLAEPEAYPPIALLAEPVLRLGGVRISPATGCRQRTFRFTGLQVQPVRGGAPLRVALPAGARTGLPVFSHDGRRFAFARDLADGIELWVGETATGAARAVPGLRLDDVLGRAFAWTGEGKLLVRAVPRGRGALPEAPAVPAGPVVEETAGKASQMATYQDLLRTPHDEAVFEHFARAQLALVDPAPGTHSTLGEPGLYTDAEPSPDGRYLLVRRLRKPFSTRVPFFYFARTVEVWDASGRPVATVADLPVADEVPRQGVPTGPRQVAWQPLVPATLVWVEAQDGGDPRAKVEHRERVMSLGAPFAGPAAEVLRLTHRFAGVDWTAEPGVALVTEYDRDRRWRTTSLVDLARPAAAKVVFDLSARDAYGDPGDPVTRTLPTGERVAVQDGSSIYLSGAGASESGDRPFLDRLDLATLAKQRLFHCADGRHERFLAFVGGARTRALVRSESPTDPPNLLVVDLASGARRKLGDYRDPVPLLARATKELVRYAREDGVPLSGTLYLPPGYVPGTRLPALVWAYPLEYSDPSTAGQVRGSPSTYARVSGASPLAFLTQGYAVLMDATMPVVGDPETMNDTYVEQISAAAEAAVDLLDARGVADRRRVVVGGHSYGAFMTANLLAHTDLFAAGIARSGAYNRTLTPFGFQSERRSFWEAPELYLRVSPFTYAHRIDEPLLLVHGEADNNSGTYPVQSERLYQALRGNGGTARYVVLPHESHGYRARESVLHTLAEMIEWADRWAKSRPEGLVAPPPR